MSDLNTVSVNILGKEYQVACPPEEVDALTRAARFLDSKMEEIRASGKVVGLDRIAVMAALNITNEFLTGQHQLTATQDEVGSRITTLANKVSQALAKHKQMDL